MIQHVICLFFSNHQNASVMPIKPVKLIELTEGANGTKKRRRESVRKVSELGKGKLITTYYIYYIELTFCFTKLFYLFGVSGLMRSQWYSNK